MAQIGRKGGQTVSRNRDHMAQIGRKGGQARKDTGESTPKSQ
jgi:general stress protein YciG